MASKYELFRDSENAYRYHLKAANGEIILSSEAYTSKAGALNGIASVRENSPLEGRYERLTARNGQYYFNLKAANREVIGTSEMYTTQAGLENGIGSVKTNGPTARVVDLTD